jgi:hypothetical protein
MMKVLKTVALILSLGLFVLNNTNAQNTETSVLAEGDIFKISIPQTGIYKIDYNFLSSIEGFNVDNIDPRKIHIYGNEGGFVPQMIAEERVDDLTDNNIYIEGEADGSFDRSDFIVFYGQGPDVYNIDNGDYEFEKNPYENNSYFFIKIESEDGPRVQNIASVTNPEVMSENRESIYRHETDRINLLSTYTSGQGTGKEWFGESFANETNQNFSNSFPFADAVSGSELSLEVRFVGRNENAMSFDINVGDDFINNNTIARTSLSNFESIYAQERIVNETVTLSGPNPNVEIDFFPNGSQGEGWLDYIQMIGIERNTYNGEPLFLIDRSMISEESYGFQITGSESLMIWDITDPSIVNGIAPNTSGSQTSFGFETENRLKAFVAFDKDSDLPQPEFLSQIANQNVHSIMEADFVIITHNNFIEAAENLARHRNENDGLNVVVVDIAHIYNEFSSGSVDPGAIRDFCRMVHLRDPDFRFLLLLGDASYDYRGLNSQLEFQNFIPTYQTDESLHPVDGFPTDDFFGLLSDDEGSDRLDGGLELGIGRIPAQTLEEANAVVNKIINYDTSPNTLGDWRMRIGFTADDEDNNTHIGQADRIAILTEDNHPEFIQQKVYFDAFNQEATPGGSRYPDANAAITENIENGQLVVNYLGHGGPKGWAQERVLQNSDIINWNNFNTLPLIITATCSFTGFDEPSFISAGENAILNPVGGAIALFTTVRAVYSSQNERLTRQVFENIFLRNEGRGQRLGDILTDAQNEIVDRNLIENTRKFLLMGDPSMRLALPSYNVELKTINGIEVDDQRQDTIGALDRAVITGDIESFDGEKVTDFNGEVQLTIFDKSSELQTLDNDNNGRVFDFELRKDVLFKGSASVTNGSFAIDIILPQDIDFEFGTGMFSFYASDGVSTDAGGQYSDIIIGGTSSNEISDNEGPEIDIFFNDRSFISGGEIAANAELIIDLSDESGINLSTTSIGHDITAKIDDRNQSGFVLNNFYTPNVDESGSGTVNFRLDDLETGFHKIYVKAWDILNNSSEEVSEFVVSENIEGFVSNVINYPNPFVDRTNFAFEHDLGTTDLDITIDIFSLSGTLIQSINETRFSGGNRIDGIDWNGSDFTGGKIPNGIYLYKIKLVSNELSLERESDLKKLVILN